MPLIPVENHPGLFRDSVTNAIVNRSKSDFDHYDKTIECVQPIPKSKQRHVNVYGFNKKNTWSENISRQMSLPERKEFKKWLKSHGFNLD